MVRLAGYISKNNDNSAAVRAYNMLANKTDGMTNPKVTLAGATYAGLMCQYLERSPVSFGTDHLPEEDSKMAIGYSVQKKPRNKNVSTLLQKDHNSSAVYFGESDRVLVEELRIELDREMQTEKRIENLIKRQKDCSLIVAYGNEGKIFAGASGRNRLMYAEDARGWGIASDWGAFTQTPTNNYQVAGLMIIENGVKTLGSDLEPSAKERKMEAIPLPKSSTAASSH